MDGAVPRADVLLPLKVEDGDGVRPEGAGLHAGEARPDVRCGAGSAHEMLIWGQRPSPLLRSSKKWVLGLN